MDTVTEANLAIALAQEGGIGIIHKNMTAQAQAAEVNKVKRHEAGMVADPITIGPDMIVADVIRLTREHNISGLPVVQGEKVLGMVTHRDLRFEDRMDAKISEIMTPAERLITIKEGATLDDAKKLMHEHRLERVLVVDEQLPPSRLDDRQRHHQSNRTSVCFQRQTRQAACRCCCRRRSRYGRTCRAAG